MEMDEVPVIRSCSSIAAEKKKKRSSPSSNKGEEKSLCFFAYTGYHLQHNRKDPVVYRLDFNGKKRNFCRRCCVEIKDGGVVEEEEEEEKKKKKMRIGAGCVNEITPLKTRWVPNGGDMVVSLGSTVYVLGGLTHKQKKEENFSDKVLYFDTSSCSNPIWKRGPDMLNPRNSSNGDAIVLEGKIYVFGGTGTDPWAEVFDPKNQSWEPLPIPLPPPKYEKGKTRVIYAYGNPVEEKKIVVNAYSCDPDIYTPYEYHVKSGNWKKGAFTFEHKPTVVGNLYYYLSDGELVAKSLNTDRCYYGKIRGYGDAKVSEYDYYEPEPTMVHLGGTEFCLLSFLPVVGNRTKIRCTKFKVSKRVCDHTDRNEGTLEASVVAHVSDIVDRSLCNEHILVL